MQLEFPGPWFSWVIKIGNFIRQGFWEGDGVGILRRSWVLFRSKLKGLGAFRRDG